jgi:hypothetical protein
MNNTNELISNIVSDNKSGAADVFQSMMNDKIADVINTKMSGVGASMLKQVDEPTESETES